MMNLKEYARHRGVSPTAVRKALKEGRITGVYVDDAWQIDANTANREWERNTKPAHHPKRRIDIGETEPAPVEKPSVSNVVVGVPSPRAPNAPPWDGGEIDEGNCYDALNISTAKEKHWKARAAERDYRVSMGELLERTKVRRDAFDTLRQVRDALLNIPDRVSADLAAENNAFEVNRKLTTEIRLALQTLAEAIEKAAREQAEQETADMADA